MATDFKKLIQSVPWKRYSNIIVKVFSDFKNLSLLGLLGFILYGIAWDTVLRPNLENLKARDEVIQKQKEVLGQRDNLQKQYDVLERQLKGLTQDLIPVPAGSSGKVISVSESGELLKMTRGEMREAFGLQALQPPHDRLENASLTSTGDDKTVNLLSLLNADTAATPSANPQTAPSPAEASNTAPVLAAEQYDYELKVTGTYAALIDLLNQLVLHPKLVKINKVVITKAPGNKPEDEPDPKEFPDYPIKLEMVVSLALFLYATDAAAS
jgi:hypothetical protein